MVANPRPKNPPIVAFVGLVNETNNNCATDTGTFTGGGPLPNGYIEIQSVDSTSVTLRVFQSFTHTEHNFIFEADGHYTASICP